MNKPQVRIGQAFKYNKQSGIIVISVYVSWQNDPLKFSHTRVIGSQQLKVNRNKENKALGFYDSWDEAQAGFQNLHESSGYIVCEPLWSLDDVLARVNENRDKREKSLKHMPPKR